MARAHVDPEAWAKKVRIWKIAAIALGSILVITITAVLLLNKVILPSLRDSRGYSQAEEALAAGNIPEAIDRFSVLWDYEDCRDRATELAFSAQPDDSFLQMIQAAKPGDTVTFGVWEQDGNPGNGPEPISWFVLADGEGRLLLWSEQILDQQPYNDTDAPITWAECTLRVWLNDSFYHTAFTPEEQMLIPLTRVKNVGNPASGAEGGADTEDDVYILSDYELRTYYIYNPYLEKITAVPTSYAISRGTEVHTKWRTACWWLRSPGIQQNCVNFCDMSGSILLSRAANHAGFGVRPIIWVFSPGRTETTLYLNR